MHVTFDSVFYQEIYLISEKLSISWRKGWVLWDLDIQIPGVYHPQNSYINIKVHKYSYQDIGPVRIIKSFSISTIITCNITYILSMPWDLIIDKQYYLLFILLNFIIYYTIGCGTQLCFKIKIFFQTNQNLYPLV